MTLDSEAKSGLTSLEKKDNDGWVKFFDDNYRTHPHRLSKFTIENLNQRWMDGDQLQWWDEESRSLDDVEVTRSDISQYNFMRMMLNVYVAKMVGDNPTPFITPHRGNTEDVDQDASRVENQIAEMGWKNLRVPMQLIKLMEDGAVKGRGVFHVYFDNTKGDELDEGERFGEIVLKKIDLNTYFPDPYPERYQDRRWVMLATPYPITVVEERFPGHAPFTPESLMGEWEEELPLRQEELESAGGKELATVFVREIFLAPNKTYKKGKHIIIINKKVVSNEDNPNGIKEFKEIQIDNGKGYAVRLMPLQRDYNKAQSQLIENAFNMGAIQVWLPPGCRVDDSQVNDLPGGVLTGGDVAPQIIAPLALPDYLVKLSDTILQKAKMVMNLHDVDFAQIPHRGTGTSSLVVEQLKESSKVSFTKDMNALKEFCTEVVSWMLFLFQEHYTEDELLLLVGKNKAPEVRKFLEAKISPDNIDVRIDIGSGFEPSPGSRRTELLNFLDRKQNIDPDIPLDYKEVGKILGGVINIDQYNEDKVLDEKKAKYNLDLVKAGGKDSWKNAAANLTQFDNLREHVRVFTDFLKSPELYTDGKMLKGEVHKGVTMYISHCFVLMNQIAQMKAATQQQQTPQGGQPQLPAAQQPNVARNNLELGGSPPVAPDAPSV